MKRSTSIPRSIALLLVFGLGGVLAPVVHQALHPLAPLPVEQAAHPAVHAEATTCVLCTTALLAALPDLLPLAEAGPVALLRATPLPAPAPLYPPPAASRAPPIVA